MDILSGTALGTKKKKKSKYLVFDSTDESKEVLRKYTEHWDGI